MISGSSKIASVKIISLELFLLYVAHDFVDSAEILLRVGCHHVLLHRLTLQRF